MSYNIMRTGKINTRKKITEASAHNFRTRLQGNIDASKTSKNKILWNPLEVNTAVASDLQHRLTSYYEDLGVKERKDNVLMQEFVVSASPAFFKGMPSEKVEEWAVDQLEFMKKEFGENVKIAVLHLDEKTPHLHFLLSTEIKTVKSYKNRHGACSKETWSLNAKRWGPEFLKDLHTRHAEHNKKWGLKRGEQRSEAKHKPVKDYYRELQRLQERMEGKVNQLEMVPELTGIIEVLVETIEGLDPPNRSLTRLARLATSLASKIQKQEHGGVAPKPPFFGSGRGVG